MPRFAPLALSAAALATTLVWASPAVAAAPVPVGGHSANTGREQVLELVARQTQITFIDNDGPGTSQGDELVLAGDLLRGSAVVGSFDEVCTLTRVGPVPDTFSQQCVGTLSLADGDLTIQGVVRVTAAGPGVVTVAITGGTGRYRTAHGYINAVNTSDTETDLTLHIIR
ncbi:allene oxide cyclase barrel-like domain-containing protein [Streptomyces coffeae]|uniref:Allene oxide cyclase barrel-like domain-containing protein n=1 Tax=Streptomyces coffeae TaxID=621382 RepID=A0ABS1N8R1_9ACTN|nr:hypothetical protein [Streptomyces coffeae]MBL1096466.1 hypothetical protein [Streptomyces coffeae]